MTDRARELTSAQAELLLAALSHLPDAVIAVLDRDLRFVVTRGTLGDRSRDELLALEGRPAGEATPPETWASFEPLMRAALVGESTTMERPIYAQEHGRELVSIGPVRDSAGAIIGVVAITSDISAQTRLMEALADSEAHLRLVVDSAAVGMALVAPDGTFLDVNPALARLLGYEPDELLGQPFRTILLDEDVADAVEVQRQLASGGTGHVERRRQVRRKDGSLVWTDISVTSARSAEGTHRFDIAQYVDVTAEVENAQEAAEVTRQYQLLAENASDVVYSSTDDGHIVWMSQSVTQVLGFTAAEMIGQRAQDLVHPDDLHLVYARRERRRGGEAIGRDFMRFRTAAGDYRDMAVSARRLPGPDRLGAVVVVGLRDITDEVRARRQLARSERQFRLAMEHAPVGMAISDTTGAFVQVNSALARLLAIDEEHLLGRSVADFLAPDEQHMADEATQALDVRRDESMMHEHQLIGHEHTVWVQHSATLLRDDDGSPLFYVHQFVDQTEAHELRQDLEYRASHDALTGVVNRGELLARLDRLLRLSKREHSWLGVLFIDIDNLKPLNDEYGHHTGDVAILAVAERLRTAVRARDIVGRIGGDEFVVLLESLQSRDELLRIAEKCRTAVSGPIEVDGRVIELSVSVGAVLADQDESSDEVVARADHALHRAKAGGRNQTDLD